MFTDIWMPDEVDSLKSLFEKKKKYNRMSSALGLFECVKYAFKTKHSFFIISKDKNTTMILNILSIIIKTRNASRCPLVLTILT